MQADEHLTDIVTCKNITSPSGKAKHVLEQKHCAGTTEWVLGSSAQALAALTAALQDPTVDKWSLLSLHSLKEGSLSFAGFAEQLSTAYLYIPHQHNLINASAQHCPILEELSDRGAHQVLSSVDELLHILQPKHVFPLLLVVQQLHQIVGHFGCHPPLLQVVPKRNLETVLKLCKYLQRQQTHMLECLSQALRCVQTSIGAPDR